MRFLFTLTIWIVTAIALQCVPPYQSCPNGACSIFKDKCGLCSSVQLVCPDGKTCVTDYNDCMLPMYLNQTFTVEQRLLNLLSVMTIEEKVSQLVTPVAALERLGIPTYEWSHEALHGVARENGPATSFPQVIGLGATFDSDLIHRIGRAISDEARAKYSQDVAAGGLSMGITFYAPNINIYRDPRWGRGHETPGEDPFLTSVYATNYVRGVQYGSDSSYLQAVACCKHYVAYNFENSTVDNIDRHSFNAVVSTRDLLETYLPAFKACVMHGKGQTVMCSYNALNGVPTCASKDLLVTTLRESWGFDGFVVSDEGAINDILTGHHYVPSKEDAAVVAITSGCDQELPPNRDSYYPTLIQSVQSGKISVSVIDAAVANVFRVRMRLGLLDNPWKISYNFIPPSVVASEQHKAIALEAARKSIVLLKNNNILPFNNQTINTLAVIGPNAAVTDILLGNYAGNPTAIVSILDGIKQKLNGKQVLYAPGCAEQWCTDQSLFGQAVDITKSADAIVMVIGIRSCPYDNQCWIGRAEIEGEQKDRTTIDLPGYQVQLLNAVLGAKGSKPLVVVLVNGGSITMNNVVNSVDALLTAFYPGEQGGNAVADVLFGDYNPGGRLTTTWVKAMSDLPPYLDMSMKERTYKYFSGIPLFPFGFGLSYTSFQYSNLSISTTSIRPCQSITITVNLSNSGKLIGDEVVQVYISLMGRSVPTANLQLVGFERVNSLKPAQSATVTFNIGYEHMTVVTDVGEVVIEPGVINVSVGGGQPKFTDTMKTSFTITGVTTPVTNCIAQ